MKLASKLATLLAALALPLVLAQTASAAGTSAGTVITNQATLDYTVGGNPQPTANSTLTTFNVDRKVNFNITYVPAAFVDVFPGSSNQALTFTVTNSGNDTQDLDLTVAQLINGTGVLTGTDNIDASAVRLFRDSNGNGTFQSGADTDITSSHYLDELAPDASVTVFIVGDFPTPQVNANVAGLTLTAQALHGHGPTVLGAAIAGGATTDTVSGPAIYTVFADVTDGQPNLERVPGAFRITAPVLNVNKQAAVIWDPVNYNSTPRSIPGSLVQYAITISNNAGALTSAQLTVIKDTLDGNTTLDPNLLGQGLNGGSPTPTTVAGESFQVTHNAADRSIASPSYYGDGAAITVTGQDIEANLAALLPAQAPNYSAGELKPGQSVTITFNVRIN